MNRRIVLVDLFWTRDKDQRIPLGHGSLLAALRCERTLDVRSVVRPVNQPHLSIDALVSAILKETAEVPDNQVDIGIGAYVWNEALLQRALPLLRARGFSGRIILGGPQISYAGPSLERSYPNADVFIRGNAEAALTALLRDGGRPSIHGIHYAGAPDRCEQASSDLESLASPWLNGTIPVRGPAFLRWETQRGCLFRCSFCQHRQPDARVSPIPLPESRIMREIDLFCAEGVDDIAVLDPIFNTPNGHAIEVLERFARNGYRGRLSLQCRAELVDERFLDVAEALNVCLEIGLQTTHLREERAIRRPNNLNRVQDVLELIRQRGIDHQVSLIFGLPEQTLQSFSETVRWCLERQVLTVRAFPLLLLRGTALERERDKWRLEVDNDAVLPMVVASTTFSRDDWKAMARISDALQRTEGCHPRRMDDLLRIADLCGPDVSRWHPATTLWAA